MFSSKLTLAASVAVTLLSAAGAHAAQDVTLSGDLVDYNYTSNLTSPTSSFGQPGSNGDFYTSPLLMTATYVGGPQSGQVQTLFGFCIDVYHEIGAPFGNLSYEIQQVNNNNDGLLSGTGDPLSTTQIQEIGYLTEQGAGLYSSMTPVTDLDGQLAGIQDAIWSLEYPAAGFSVTANQADSASYMGVWMAAAEANYGTFTGALYEVSPTNGSTQSFAFVTLPPTSTITGGSGAPEPVAWSLMLLGVGAVGASLRRDRLLSAAGAQGARSAI